MATGTLKMWNAERGYGFIGNDAGGSDLFLHVSALESAGIDPLADQTWSSFNTRMPNGRTAIEEMIQSSRTDPSFCERSSGLA